MRRIDFIRSLILLFGIQAVPSQLYTQYHRVFLLQCFIRGFRFYDGPKLLEQMKVGAMIELQREPKNKHDNEAIALYFNGTKIGYVPKEENSLFSKLMDSELLDLQAEITHLEPSAKAWENVAIVIYALKESTEKLPEKASYLTILETPKYSTLKISKQRIFNFKNNKNKIIEVEKNAQKFYADNKDKPIFNLFKSEEEFVTAAKEIKFVVQKPTKLAEEDIKIELKATDYYTETYFDDDDYYRYLQLKYPNQLGLNQEEVNEINMTIFENTKKILNKHDHHILIEKDLAALPAPVVTKEQIKDDIDQVMHKTMADLEKKLNTINSDLAKVTDIDKQLNRINKTFVKKQEKIIDIINDYNTALDEKFDSFIHKLDGYELKLEENFKDTEMYIAKITNTDYLTNHVTHIVEKADKVGNIFYELLLKI